MQKTSGVLLIGPTSARKTASPASESLSRAIGAEVVHSFSEARAFIEEHQPSLIIFGAGRGQEFDDFCRFCLDHSPQSLWLVASDGIPPSQLVHWSNFGRVFDFVDQLDDAKLIDKARAALEERGAQKQHTQLVKLFEDQSNQLQKLSADLEARVQKRHKALRKSLKELDGTTARLESLHKALLGIHRAATVLQMEQTLDEALKSSLGLEWVRVRYAHQSLLKQQLGPDILAIELPFQQDQLRGEVLFATKKGHRLSEEEIEFLHELSEAVALALARLQKLDQAETLKAQWQATFDSISHPLCLTTPEGEILKVNAAFQQSVHNSSFRSLMGKKWFEAFFGRDFKAPDPFEIPFSFRHSRTGRGETEHFEVVGETVRSEGDEPPRQLIHLRPVTEEVRFERRIVQASKLAELGTIGSSIAHELNNPLGGMLSFLQLILMDLKKTEANYEDIKSMEQATLRCRDIVQNLLSFARKQDLGEIEIINLSDVVDRSVRLIELQSKSKGIAILVKNNLDGHVRGSANALSQALCNLLQNSIDAIGERGKDDPSFRGEIHISLNTDPDQDDQYQLRVSDNGTGIRHDVQSQIFNPLFTTRDPNQFSGMGLTTAFTIVSEHRGSLEILSQTGSGTTAIISLTIAKEAGFTSRKTAF
jgi:signal transduction histidine kinase